MKVALALETYPRNSWADSGALAVTDSYLKRSTPTLKTAGIKIGISKE